MTRDVGFEFSRRGLRVLLVDLDPQANLSSWLGVRQVDLAQTVFQVAVDGAALPPPVRVFGMDLIPSQVDLALAEAQMLGQPGAHFALLQALEPVQDRYDVVLVDSPPSIGQLAILGAGAADKLLVPIPTRAKGLDAMPGLQKATGLYRRLRRDLAVALYIPTLYDARRSHDREVLALLRENLSPICEPLPQREAVWLDSNSAGEPVGVYAPGSPVHHDVQRLSADVARALGLEWKA